MSTESHTESHTESTADERSIIVIDYTRAKNAFVKVAKWTAKIAVPIAAVATVAYVAGHNDGIDDYSAALEAVVKTDDEELDETEES